MIEGHQSSSSVNAHRERSCSLCAVEGANLIESSKRLSTSHVSARHERVPKICERAENTHPASSSAMAKNKPYPHAPMRPPTPGSASKKRRIVYMDGSDDENTVLTGSPAVRAKQTKVVEGHKSPRPGKRARLSGPMSGATTSKAGGIQEQRRALPIFKGQRDTLLDRGWWY